MTMLNPAIEQTALRSFCDLPPITLDDLDPTPVDRRFGQRCGMTMAKASPEDLEGLHEVLQLVESFLEDGHRPFTDDDEDEPPQLSDSEFVDLLREAFGTRGFGWQRVYYAARMLIANACDPDQNHLAWRPDIERLLAGQEALEQILPS